MKILPVNMFNYQNSAARSSAKVSFGEIDGDFYPAYMSRSEYLAKKERINEKYDKMRSDFLKDSDDLEFSLDTCKKRLNNIENLRKSELSSLEKEYRR